MFSATIIYTAAYMIANTLLNLTNLNIDITANECRTMKLDFRVFLAVAIKAAAAAAAAGPDLRFLFGRSSPRPCLALFECLPMASLRCFAFRMVRVMRRALESRQ